MRSYSVKASSGSNDVKQCILFLLPTSTSLTVYTVESMSSKPIKTLLVWCHPRTRSTVLERPFLTRNDVEVVHEPLTEAQYFGPERTSLRNSAEEIASQYGEFAHATWQSCWERATTPPEGTKICFTKELAKTVFLSNEMCPLGPDLPSYHLDGNPTVIATEKLLAPDIFHVFLIRDPKDYMTSLAEKLSAPIGWGWFNKEEIGIHQIRKLYDFTASQQTEPPLVIDSDDLLVKPGVIIQHLCNLMGLKYTAEMLTWNAGDPKAAAMYAKWTGWHDTALNSTGIMPTLSPKERVQPSPEVAEAIADNTPDYEYLKSKAHKFV